MVEVGNAGANLVRVTYKCIQINWLNWLFQFKLAIIAVFIAKVEQYFKFGLIAGLLLTDPPDLIGRIAESNWDSFTIYFQFIQAVERFRGIIIVKFLNVLCFARFNLTSCLQMLHYFTFMSTKGLLRFIGFTSYFSNYFLLTYLKAQHDSRAHLWFKLFPASIID